MSTSIHLRPSVLSLASHPLVEYTTRSWVLGCTWVLHKQLSTSSTYKVLFYAKKYSTSTKVLELQLSSSIHLRPRVLQLTTHPLVDYKITSWVLVCTWVLHNQLSTSLSCKVLNCAAKYPTTRSRPWLQQSTQLQGKYPSTHKYSSALSTRRPKYPTATWVTCYPGRGNKNSTPTQWWMDLPQM